MKKMKLLTPIFCSGLAVISVLPTITSCKTDDEEEHTFKIKGGDLHLFGEAEYGDGIPGQAPHAWYGLWDNERTENVQFSLEFATESYYNNEIYIGNTDGIVKWGYPAAGIYKFYVVATYADGTTQYTDKSELIQLEITGDSQVVTPEGEYKTQGMRQEWSTPATGEPYQYVVYSGFEFLNYEGGDVPDTPRITKWDGSTTVPSNVYVEFVRHNNNATSRVWDLRVYTASGTTFTPREHTFWVHVGIEGQKTANVELKIANISKSFLNDSWDHTIELANQGTEALKDFYHIDNFVGQQKILKTTDKQEYILRVIGQKHDTMENGQKAELTFEFLTLYHSKSNPFIQMSWKDEEEPNIWHDKNNSCSLRTFLNEDFALLLPKALKEKNGIKTVMKETCLGNGSTECGSFPEYIWLESSFEIGNKDPKDMKTPIAAKEGVRYEAYTSYTASTDRNRSKYDAEGIAQNYWLRTPYYGKTGGAVFASPSGIFSATSATSEYGIAPCFCI